VTLEVAQRSHPGLDPSKQLNEDSAAHGPTPLGYVLVVCDGMGGHALGREASQLAVATILKLLQSAPATAPPGLTLSRAILEAGRAVFRLGGPNAGPARPGSTCVAVLVHGSTADIAHVGDSRVYLVRRGQGWQLTKDHSVVQELLDRGMLTAEQAKDHPEANKITRALGMKAETDVELRDPIACGAEDVFVLASDGLTDLVRTDEIAVIVSHAASLDGACEELVRMANARGGHDNITVLMGRVGAVPPMQAGASGQAAPVISAVAPTVVEAPEGLEKTIVDPRVAAPEVTAPAMPALSPPMAPMVPMAPLSPPLPRTDPPGARPSRGGWVVLMVGFAAMAVILLGVILWLVLKDR
jgi:serine/threonine protein phosphatase PrpC